MTKDKKLLLQLFLSTFCLSAFTFGGGYVIITLMKKKFVDDYHWIEEKEMLDLVAIAQSAPGPIAVNGAIVLGCKLAGIKGMIVSILGTVIPPFAILSIISLFYESFRNNSIVNMVLTGMQAGVGAVIANVVFEMGWEIVKEKSILSILIMVLAFGASYFYSVNTIYIILVCIVTGFIRTFYMTRKERHT